MNTVSPELLKAIYYTAVDSIITTDDKGVILSCNQSTARMFDYPADEIIGKNVNRFIPPQRREEYASYLDHFLKTQNKKIIETGRRLSALKRDGTIFPVSLTLSYVIIGNQNVFIGIVRDISAITHVEESLVQRSRDLERSNLDLEQFAYIASHDLQAPLRVISNYAELLIHANKGKLDPKSNDLMAFILNSAKRSQTLIKDLLHLSKVGSHVLELKLSSLESVVRRALQNLELNLKEAKGVVTHDQLPSVMVDENQMVQLFQNLIGNAIKFKSDTDPKVHISARNENGKWIFCVEDNGIGIALQHFQKIFVIFNRLQGSNEYPGTGIGLSICNKIVERHGGRIWVESAPGKGSKFFFTLKNDFQS